MTNSYDATCLPLTGLRVVDLTMVWAGPYCTQILGDFGAEVIKVESVKRFDLVRGPKHPGPDARGYPDDDPGDDPWNRTIRFSERNRNKLGLTLDLTTSVGVDLLKRLVSVSDVVVENFSAGVMDKLGIGYDILRTLRPDLVFLSMPGFGKTGPLRDSVAFGLTIETMSGIASLTGYGDGRPMKGGINTGDPIAALHAAGAVLAALFYRSQTGLGQCIDLSQQESAIATIGDVLLAYAFTGQIPRPLGNRDSARVPQGCYRCRGDDQWVSISVSNEEEWFALCQSLGKPELADDARFRTRETRWEHHDELDEILSCWTSEHGAYEVMQKLQARGVCAGAVLSNRDIHADQHVRLRQGLIPINHPSSGLREYPAPSIRLSDTPARVVRPAPRLGEHNVHILHDILGVSMSQVRSLEEQGVIGTVPLVER